MYARHVASRGPGRGLPPPPPTLFAADIFHKFTYKKLKYHGVYNRKEDFQRKKFCLGLLGLYHEEKVTFNKAIYV